MTSTIGIPIKLLNEAQVRNHYFSQTAQLANIRIQGHVVTVELMSGVVYRGRLLEGRPI